MCPNDSQPMYISPIYNRSDQLFDNEEGSDVTFRVGVEPEIWRFPGHRSVLRKNPVFKAMLATTPANTIIIPDVDGRAFDLLLRCLYNQEVKLQQVETALNTLYAAQKYMCTGLMKECLLYIDREMNVYNVLQIYQHIRVHSGQRTSTGSNEASAPPYHQLCQPYPNDNFYSVLCLYSPLLHNCLHFIDTHADQVLGQEIVEDLSSECLKEVVERDSLDVSSEVIIYNALERWSSRECKRRQLEMSPENRRAVLGEDLLFSVRFLTMDKDQFYVGPLRGDLLTKQEIAVLMGYILGHSNSSPSSAHCLLPVLSDQLLAYLKRPRQLPRDAGFRPLSGKTDRSSCSCTEETKDSGLCYCSAKIKKNKKEKKKKHRPGDSVSPAPRRRCTGSCVIDCVLRAIVCLCD